MSVTIHPSAIVHPDAALGADVVIGPFTVIEADVTIGDGVQIGSSALIASGARIGAACMISHGAVIATAPQDLKFTGEPTGITIGERTTVREYCTLNRGTLATGMTRVGSDCLLMAYTHVAHDCRVGDHVIMANVTQLGGHVHVDDWAIVGGNVLVHQFSRIGAHTMVGAGSYISKDVPPYVTVGGDPVAFSGINVIGLKRRGFQEETIELIRAFYKLIYKSGLNVTDGLARASKELKGAEVASAMEFIEASARGILRGR